MLQRWVAPCYALVLALAITAPLREPGYLLLRDAVSTPRSYLSDAALGLTEAAPRSLPQDAAVAMASAVVDGGVVVKVLLLLGLWLAGWGAARLAALVLPASDLPGQLVAVTVAMWNPYVVERLLQGHWSLLVGYGCLPWVAGAMLRLRFDPDARWWPLAFWIALAGLTATGLMLAATIALVCTLVPGLGRPMRRCAAGSLGLSVLVALPWLVASALGGSLPPPQTGVAAFAARAEPGLGTLGSLAALGGIWNADAVPAPRDTAFAVVGAVVLLGIVALGLPALRGRPGAFPLLTLAAIAVLVPAAMATGPGIAFVDAVVQAVPGLGVVRDAQKWVALAVPGYALAGAGAVVTLRRFISPTVAATVCCLALIGALPHLLGGAGHSVQYPQGWYAVAAAINADPRPVAVLPTGMMRRFEWAGSAPVLDPLPRWVRADVLTTGDLTVSGQTLLGESDHAQEVQQLLVDGADPAELAAAGVGWVVVEHGTEGETGSAEATLANLEVVYTDEDMTLYRVGGDAPGASAERRTIMLGAHAVWLLVLLAGAIGTVVTAMGGVRRRRAAAEYQEYADTEYDDWEPVRPDR